MTRIAFTPYFEEFSLVPHTHVELTSAYYQANGQFAGHVPQEKQASLDASIRLLRHDDESGETINGGRQDYHFGAKPTPKAKSHGGLPAIDALVTQDVIDGYAAAIDEFTGENIPALLSTLPDEAGVSAFVRIDRVQGALPRTGNNQFVEVFIGVYEDAAFTRQIPTAGFVLRFESDANVQSKLPHGDVSVAAYRQANDLYDLAELVAQPDVKNAVGRMAVRVMTALKASVHHWQTFDVEAWADNFEFPEIG